MHPAVAPFANSIVIFNVCGDAEAYVFDVDALAAPQREALVAGHLRAFVDNLQRQKRDPSDFVPFALLGTSMPRAAQTFDMSAPHEGTLLLKRDSGRVLYVTAADDPRAFFVADSVAQLQLRESGASVDGAVDMTCTPTTSTGFTLEQYAIVGNKLAQVIGKHTGLRGVIERLLGSS